MKIKILAIIVLLFYPLFGEWLQYEDVVVKSPFRIASLGRIKLLPNEDAFIFRGEDKNYRSLYKVSLPSFDTLRIISGAELFYRGDTLNMDDIIISNSGTYILIINKKKQIWRHSFSGSFYLFDIQKKKLTSLGNGDPYLRNVKFSPNDKLIAYVKKDNNLYTYDIEKKFERKLTNSGSETITNGHFGWLYEEELSGYDGYRWSPDSEFIAYWEEDESMVEEFNLHDELKLYPELKKIKYPKVGRSNPKLRIGVVRAKGGGRRWINTKDKKDYYLPWMKWVNDEKIAFLKIDRIQKEWELKVSDKNKGNPFSIITENDRDGWVDNDGQIYFLDDGRVIWISEKTGYKHIRMAKHSGSREWPITNGEWEVKEIKHIDENDELVYFTGNKESTFENRFYSIRFDGTDIKLLTTESGDHQIKLSGTRKYFIDTYSSMKKPKTIILKEIKSGETITIIDTTEIKQFLDYKWSFPKLIKFPSLDNQVTLDGFIILPSNYDPQKRYPVIMHGYGMPGTQIVWNRWSNIIHQYFAQKGFLVFSMDTRGMGGRGEKFKNLSYGNMAKYLAKDQLAGLEYLIQEGYADSGRIGAWGASGGGYFTCLMLTKNGPYFKAGVAISPVTDFRLYDTAYTERYMGLLKDNKDGYDSTSTLKWIYRMNGSLLLLHGSMDDNVHSQNTFMFVKDALEANKDVEWYIYPGKNHGIYGDGYRKHLYRKIFEFFEQKL